MITPMEHVPYLRVTPYQLGKIVEVLEAAQLFMMAQGGREIMEREQTLKDAIAEATPFLRLILTQ